MISQYKEVIWHQMSSKYTWLLFQGWEPLCFVLSLSHRSRLALAIFTNFFFYIVCQWRFAKRCLLKRCRVTRKCYNFSVTDPLSLLAHLICHWSWIQQNCVVTRFCHSIAGCSLPLTKAVNFSPLPFSCGSFPLCSIYMQLKSVLGLNGYKIEVSIKKKYFHG